MFHPVSYRRGVLEGVILFTLGRLGALLNPVIFPGWLYVAVPLLCLALQYLLAPIWATRRIASTKRERLSRRFWLLGPLLAALCFGVDLLITLAFGMPVSTLGGVPQGAALVRLFTHGANSLTLTDFGLYELKTAALLFSFFTLWVVCSRLARGGFLRFTMPAGGNRVTL
jgi:hypothetical protein